MNLQEAYEAATRDSMAIGRAHVITSYKDVLGAPVYSVYMAATALFHSKAGDARAVICLTEMNGEITWHPDFLHLRDEIKAATRADHSREQSAVNYEAQVLDAFTLDILGARRRTA